MANYDYPTDEQLGFCEACKGKGCGECECEHPETKVFDVFTERKGVFDDGSRCKRFVGAEAMMEFCERSEPLYGPLLVKQVGGDLSRFAGGGLYCATAGPEDDQSLEAYYRAVSGAVAQSVAGGTL